MSSVSVSSGTTGSVTVGDVGELTTEMWMRRVSVAEMMELARSPDPPGRLLLNEELSRAKPDRKVVAELLKHFPERARQENDSGSLPLHVAASNLHSIETSVLQLVLEANPNAPRHANAFGLLPIHKAVCAPKIKSTPPQTWHLQLLIDAYPQSLLTVNRENATPLHLILANVPKPQSELIEYILLREPMAAAKADIYGHYPLHKLCGKAPSEEIIDCLTTVIDAYPEAAKLQDIEGRTPLHWVCSVRDKPDLEMLGEVVDAYPEAVDVEDKAGFKPLDRLMNRGVDRCAASCLLLATKEEELYKARLMAKHVKEGQQALRGAAKVIGLRTTSLRHHEEEARDRLNYNKDRTKSPPKTKGR